MRHLRDMSGLVQQLFISYKQQLDSLAMNYYTHVIKSHGCINEMPVTYSLGYINLFTQRVSPHVGMTPWQVFFLI